MCTGTYGGGWRVQNRQRRRIPPVAIRGHKARRRLQQALAALQQMRKSLQRQIDSAQEDQINMTKYNIQELRRKINAMAATTTPPVKDSEGYYQATPDR